MGEFSRPPALILYGSAVSVSLAPQFGNFDIGIDEQPYQITYLKDNHLIIYGTCTHYVMDDELERDIPYRVDFISPNPIGYTIEQEIVPKNGVIRIVGHGSPDTEPEPAVVIKGKGVPVVFKTYDYPDSCYVKREFRIDLKASDDALLYYRPDLLPAWYIPYADRLRG